MGRVLGLVVVLMLVAPVSSLAETVYLRDGRTVWGTEVSEERDQLVVVRPSGTLRVPKRDVDRVQRVRTSLPAHYSVPEEPPAPAAQPAPGVKLPPGQAAEPSLTPSDAARPLSPSPFVPAPAPPGPPSAATALPSPGPPPVK